MSKVGILGVGSYLPVKKVTNFDLEKILDTSDEWIRLRTGIKERRFVSPDQAASDLAAKAAERAIKDAGISKEEIDLIIVGTNSPDTLYPATACLVQDKIGAKNAAAFDLQAGCTGWVYASIVGAQFIETGMYKHVLAIGVEAITRLMDEKDRDTYVLFGDGAGATVLGNVDKGGLLSSVLYADGSLAEHIILPAGGSRLPLSQEVLDKRLQYTRMNGREVFKFAVREIGKVSLDAIKEAGLTVDDIRWFIPHQANLRIIEAGIKRIGIPEERVVVTLDKYGNSSAATVPIALDEIYREGKIKAGDKLLMVSFGAGMTSGGFVLEWSK
ncbi:MAG: beta-ketoacyl-ACP synthase III [Caldisericota bacterium]|nr:beta-ketoacyl-ACP synthase III [Caldisericota bacterium]